MADTLKDKLKKQQQVLAGVSDPTYQQDPSQPKQGMGDLKYQEMSDQANAPEQEYLPATPAPAENKPLQAEDVLNSNTLASKLQKRDRESDDTINQLQSLANEYAQNKTIPKDRTDELKAAIADARNMYNERATRNDWLDVAQSLSRAVAQFGAAAQGQRTGRDMAGLNFGPGVDFNARSDRAAKEYGQEVANLKDINNDQRLADLNKSQAEKDIYGAQSKSLEDTLNAQREREKDEDVYNRQIELEKMRGDIEALRNTRRDKALFDRENDKDRSLQIQSMRNDLKKSQDELQATRQLANNAVADDDLKSKSRDKLAAEYGALSAKAGVDPSALADITEQSKDKGIFGTGLFRGEDKKKKADLINNQLIKPKEDKIRSLMQAIDSLSRRSSSSPDSSPAPEAAAPSSSGTANTVRIQGPSGQIAEVPADKADKYLSKPGYTRVK